MASGWIVRRNDPGSREDAFVELHGSKAFHARRVVRVDAASRLRDAWAPAIGGNPSDATIHYSMRFPRGSFTWFACWLLIAGASMAQKRNKKEDITQTLQLPRELPAAVTGETRRLSFHVTPLSSKGLLSQQVRDALKALVRETNGETVLKIRAFVAGSADLRRVRDLVSETFAARKQPLPALSLLQAGGLPMEGAQVEMEAVSAAKKDVNPNGLAWISPLIATADDPLGPVSPLMEKSLGGLGRMIHTAGAEPSDVVRITCFVSSLQNIQELRKLVEADYPHAAANYVKTQRAPAQALAACEAVTRLRTAPKSRLELMMGEESATAGAASIIAEVGAQQVVLTGSQDSFGYQDKDAQLAFQRVLKSLEGVGGKTEDVAFANLYPLSPGLANQVRKVRSQFWSGDHPPAGTVLVLEGLPSMDAGFAVELVAAK
jgi:enamine deaminase RidA (YjgF/YER057c/UK114 family)